MSLFYLQMMLTINGGFYDQLVQVPIAERLTWLYTWRLYMVNISDGAYINENGKSYEFFSILFSNLDIFKQYYRHVNPFSEALLFVCIITVAHYVVSVVSNNYSQVDKAWSILPVVYAWHFFYSDYLNRGTIHPRLLFGAVLITLWGFRLTWNFARKGGYEWSGQDYRYPYIKNKIGPVAMGFLNATVIAPFQDALLLMMVAPLYFTNLTYLGDTTVGVALTKMDLLATFMFLIFLGIEMTADEQQYLFQTEKYCLLKHQRLSSSSNSDNSQQQLQNQQQISNSDDDYRRGFLTRGLFKYSRHPNFFAEMGIWWSIYLFSVSSTISLTESLYEEPVQWWHASTYVNWTIVGPLTLTLLFQGSTWLTELISSEKYPEYRLYQQSVNRFIPWRSTWTSQNVAHDKND
ncbi:unnamed protein product [Absidia cylindrospora]